MDRRRLLMTGSVLLVVVLAGCSAAGSLEMHPAAADTELADRVSRPTTPVGDEPVRHRQVVRRAIENGSTTVQSRQSLVEPGLPFAHEDRYYTVSSTVVGQRQATAVNLEIDYNGTARSNATVAYSALPARDRALIDSVLPPKRERRTDGYDFGASATYNDTELNRSALVTEEYAAVRYEGTAYPVAVRDTEPVTVRTYEYTASVVANSSTEYATQLRERYLFTLSDLSKSERTVVEEALNDTYYADGDDDEKFRSVLDRFQRHVAVQETENRGTWIVRYEGAVYVADLSYEGFDQ